MSLNFKLCPSSGEKKDVQYFEIKLKYLRYIFLIYLSKSLRIHGSVNNPPSFLETIDYPFEKKKEEKKERNKERERCRYLGEHWTSFDISAIIYTRGSTFSFRRDRMFYRLYLDPRHVDYTRHYKYRKGRNRRICMLRIMNIYSWYRVSSFSLQASPSSAILVLLSFFLFFASCLFTFRHGTALTFYFICTLSRICATLASTESVHHLSRCTRDVSLKNWPRDLATIPRLKLSFQRGGKSCPNRKRFPREDLCEERVLIVRSKRKRTESSSCSGRAAVGAYYNCRVKTRSVFVDRTTKPMRCCNHAVDVFILPQRRARFIQCRSRNNTCACKVQ